MLEESMPETFQGLVKDMGKNHGQWSVLANSAAPYNEDLPGAWHDKVILTGL